jgi:2-polyprenyl-3-methyl-5-hydroxy-6-metoxy-1,4-benzoquinol methylase
VVCQPGLVVEHDISAHYADGREASRLTRSAHGRLEFVRTQELVRRALPPPPARVLDVGGGTGVHAHWLAEDGYVVQVVDLVAHHVETASALPGVTAEVGDVRSLATPTGTVDVVLL